MASRAVSAAGPRGRALLLAGADHIKYELGMPRRLRRYAAKAGRADARIETVLLSPTPSDTLSASEARLALALGEESDAPPLADYLMYPAPAGGSGRLIL